MNKKFIKPVCLFLIPCKVLLIFLIFLNFSCTTNNDKSLIIKDWSVTTEDLENISAALKFNKWKKVKTSLSFKTPASLSSGFYYIWLKGRFFIEDDPSSYYGINLGRVYTLNEVYCNEVNIGSTGPDEIHNINEPRSYKVPSGILKHGENNLFIHLGIPYHENGGLPDLPVVAAKKAYLINKIIDETIFVYIPLGSIILILGLLTLTIIAFIYNKKDKKFLILAVLLIQYALYIYSIFTPYRNFSFHIFKTYTNLSFPITAIMNIILLQTVYRFFISHLNKSIISFFSVISVLIVVISFIDNYAIVSLLQALFALLTTIVSIPVYLYILFILNRIKPNNFVFRILIAYMVLYNATIVLCTASFTFGWFYEYILFVYASPIASYLFMILYAREALESRLQFEALTRYFKTPTGHGENVSISSEMEEKIKEVIGFIDNNFKTDITRESLADAVNMSVNYMSKVFKAYTGKKVNDYINELRVEDAQKRLLYDNSTIISIAFTTGFNSLTSFNRIFKLYTGQTPSELRKARHK